MTDAERIKVGVHPSVVPWAPEVTYTLATLLRVAGFAREVRVCLSDDDAPLDLYYGPDPGRSRAAVAVRAGGLPFTDAGSREPRRLRRVEGLPLLEFGDEPGTVARTDGRLVFANDIVFAAYWLLSGAREPRYPRDRRENLDLRDAAFRTLGLPGIPIVSLYGRWLRDHFARLGRQPRRSPWEEEGAAAVALTHDVDYPEIIPWIEAPRILRERGVRGLSTAAAVLAGRSDFWKFREWVDFADGMGGRPAFYFMARRGSLARYLGGVPDVFYDVTSARFRAEIRYLVEAGCEIGLHASYLAYRGEEALREERRRIEEVAGGPVLGVRHHYWHVDPDDPVETLRRQCSAGLAYDTSLAFEFYPGFRRGICHPFRVFHPGERRELDIVELPPTWMDDHFDRRLLRNGIEEPDRCADDLLAAVRATGGIAVLDYHVRGMNADVHPRYGAWLADFLGPRADAVRLRRPVDLYRDYREHEALLESASSDLDARGGRTPSPARAGAALH